MRRKRRANHNNRICIGTVSHGTMRSEDLIPAFIGHFDQLVNRSKSDRNIVAEIKRSSARKGYYDAEDGVTASEDVDTLFDILCNYAPDYMYFGAHPGDGCDYGYWLSDDWAESFDGLRVDDTSDVPSGYTGEVMHVSDHGNVTLYRATRGRLREVWAIA